MKPITRRTLLGSITTSALAATLLPGRAGDSQFNFDYILASCMYGTLPLEKIVPEVPKTGASRIDIWPKVHGNQREQMEEMGQTKFSALLKEHNVKLGCLTRYDLGPFKLQPEMKVARNLGGKVLVCGGSGPKGLKGDPLKAAVKVFAEKMKPHIAAAEDSGVTIGIENHGNNLIDSPDAIKWLMEFAPSQHIGIALAPYHLESLGVNAEGHAELIGALGNRIVIFYAWQHGMGCHKKLPKEQELLQMPGRGSLNFVPIVRALKKINYRGSTSIFMHPVPRGIPILETAEKVTEEINRARKYLDECLAQV